MECPICYENMESHVNIMTTECGHTFHTGCMMKHVSLGHHGCPMCRANMVESSSSSQEDDEDENEDDVDYDDDDDDESFYTEVSVSTRVDIRRCPLEQENYTLRGFRWLFQQNTNEKTEIQRGHIPPPNELNEHLEEQMENEWAVAEEYSHVKHKEAKQLAHYLKKERNVSYEALVQSFLVMYMNRHYDVMEFMHSADSIIKHVQEKMETMETI